ncbi:unnamed protein product [Mytilus edulis]|uniref:Farnesoic acid O-methyl transferase domain-containing protein n=1 Tax=Mytilus edulis TaxID=6550 RepID=A0A8S3T273_MYTED|nr:unnamed protein product [Mytilus edulis]
MLHAIYQHDETSEVVIHYLGGLPLEFTVTHPDDKLLSTEGVSLSNVNFLQFEARGYRDVNLIFHDAQFVVNIGGWGNTISALYIEEHRYLYHGPLLNSEYKPFWISWNSFQVYVGVGSIQGSGVIFHEQPQCPIKVIDSTFGSNYGETVDYRVNQADMIRVNGRFCGQDKSCDIVSIILLVESRSRIECAIVCKITSGCTFFVFNINLHQCKLFENGVGSDIVVSEKVYWECSSTM